MRIICISTFQMWVLKFNICVGITGSFLKKLCMCYWLIYILLAHGSVWQWNVNVIATVIACVSSQLHHTIQYSFLFPLRIQNHRCDTSIVLLPKAMHIIIKTTVSYLINCICKKRSKVLLQLYIGTTMQTVLQRCHNYNSRSSTERTRHYRTV